MSDAQDLTAPLALAGMLDYQHQSIVSRTLLKKSAGTVTLFAFDAGEGLSTHTTPYDALLHVVEGQADITVADTTHEMRAGQVIGLPADVPHAVRATHRFKMLLVMIRSAE